MKYNRHLPLPHRGQAHPGPRHPSRRCRHGGIDSSRRRCHPLTPPHTLLPSPPAPSPPAFDSHSRQTRDGIEFCDVKHAPQNKRGIFTAGYTLNPGYTKRAKLIEFQACTAPGIHSTRQKEPGMHSTRQKEAQHPTMHSISSMHSTRDAQHPGCTKRG